ncbi:hypothetical protein HNP38_003611 [Chryseobacterium defluvii]|uniref:Uncharacterized protein n=1 Tax=Chryseobacterium defluvii TaxID=160396 RepID=A0A840KFC2_9FLAO|nr:hypothetical protein [Chryseobacterium defluvii]
MNQVLFNIFCGFDAFKYTTAKLYAHIILDNFSGRITYLTSVKIIIQKIIYYK